MSSATGQAPSAMKVAAAFTTVYLVWGSTYFFIRLSVEHIPPMMVGGLRYLFAGTLMLLWCVITGERIFSWKVMSPAIVSGILLLIGGNGLLIWAEQYVPSSLAAILLASGPIWFVLLDKGKWKENFGSKSTIAGLVVGSVGVLLLFGERLFRGEGNAVVDAGQAGAAHVAAGGGTGVTAGSGASVIAGGGAGVTAGGHDLAVVALAVLVLASISWAAGSLYSKYKAAGNPNSVNAGWQMMAAGLLFVPLSWVTGEWTHFRAGEVPMISWLSIAYLVTMGSLVGYSAFTWLLQVRPAAQVSTHAYVNPVVAVLLGVLFADERLSPLQLVGLLVILASVLLINLAKYRPAAGGLKSAATGGKSAAAVDLYKLSREKDMAHE